MIKCHLQLQVVCLKKLLLVKSICCICITTMSKVLLIWGHLPNKFKYSICFVIVTSNSLNSLCGNDFHFLFLNHLD